MNAKVLSILIVSSFIFNCIQSFDYSDFDFKFDFNELNETYRGLAELKFNETNETIRIGLIDLKKFLLGKEILI